MSQKENDRPKSRRDRAEEKWLSLDPHNRHLSSISYASSRLVVGARSGSGDGDAASITKKISMKVFFESTNSLSIEWLEAIKLSEEKKSAFFS